MVSVKMEHSPNLDLIFNMSQLLKEHVGATRRVPFEAASLALYDDEGNNMEVRNLKGEVKVTRLSDGLLVQGDVQADVDVLCSRCLDNITLSVDARLEEQFKPTVDVETGRVIKREDEAEDEDAFAIDPNHHMDLSEPIRQALLVALPMRPLCREDCKGLCPVCGANRNTTDCGHTDEPMDSRWEGLRELDLADFPVDRNAN
jgi:uncharacterized protein